MSPQSYKYSHPSISAHLFTRYLGLLVLSDLRLVSGFGVWCSDGEILVFFFSLKTKVLPLLFLR